MTRFSDRLLCTTALVGLGACTQVLGLDKVTQGETDASVADAGPPDATLPDASPDAGFLCTEMEILPAIGETNFDTDTASHDLNLSCGSVGETNDLQFLWRAPVTDYFVFDTLGSSFDTVLGLLDDCGGAELGCNNRVGAATGSELVRRFESGDEVVIAVDGFAGDKGAGVLNIARVLCPDSDLEGQSFPLTLTTLGSADDYDNACGGAGQEDRAYHWSAPEAGLYTFGALSTGGFRPIVSVVDGPRCSDAQLGCNAAGASDTQAVVTRRMQLGQSVSIYVDGVDGAGVYELDVSKIDEVCPGESLPMNGALYTGTYSQRTMAPSCGLTEARNGVNVIQGFNDASLLVEIPAVGQGCFGSCDLDIRAGGAFAAYLLENGDCSGPELQCSVAAGGPAGLIMRVDRAESEVVARTLVVATQNHSISEFTVLVDCIEACF